MSSPVPTSALPPAEMLEGLELLRGWVVKEKRQKLTTETGGFFSIGYECENKDGRRAFLKAIDLHTAVNNSGGNVLAVLQPLVAGAQAEKDLLAECRRMDHVITSIDTGDIDQLGGNKLDIPVPYIIFERADATARAIVTNPVLPSHGWRLRSLHHVAVGLSQLHGRRIAHQDVKLSNILFFEREGISKVSDLGRSIQHGRSVPHDQIDWPGARAYAPPEFVFGYEVAREFNVRRFAPDLFMLGGAACAIFTGAPINTLLYDQLPKEFHPQWIDGPYTGTFEFALPYIEQAFEQALATIDSSIPVDAPYKASLVAMVAQWCQPDPTKRGHPKTRTVVGAQGNAYSLERYLAELDVLAHKAQAYDRQLRK